MATFTNPGDCLAHRAREFEKFVLTHKFAWDNDLGVGRVDERNAIQHGSASPTTSTTRAEASTFQQGGGGSNLAPVEPKSVPRISPRLAYLRQFLSSSPTPPPSLSSSQNSSSSSSPLLGYPFERPLFSTEYFEVRKSGNKGFGAFAIKDIEIDTKIISEKPLFKGQMVEVYVKYEGLTREERASYNELCYWDKLQQPPTLARFMTNRFEISPSVGGIFVKSSRFNHTCPAFKTCSYRYNEREDCLEVTAHRAIQKGEEITICYSILPKTLYSNYGFHCDCPDCKLPSKRPARVILREEPDSDEPWIRPGGRSFGNSGIVLNELTHHYYSTFGRSGP